MRDAKKKAIEKLQEDIIPLQEFSNSISEELPIASTGDCSEKERCSTFKNNLEALVFSRAASTATSWIVLLNLGAIVLPYSYREQSVIDFCRHANLGLVSLFMLEILAKFYTMGVQYFFVDTWILVDLIIVTGSFVASIIEFWTGIYQVSVLLTTRLLGLSRVSLIGRKIHKWKVKIRQQSCAELSSSSESDRKKKKRPKVWMPPSTNLSGSLREESSIQSVRNRVASARQPSPSLKSVDRIRARMSL